MEKVEFNKEFARKIIEMEKDLKIGEQITFMYENSNSNIWNITITREEESYYPFSFSIKGEKIGTNETWNRRYVGIKEAILHIVNNFNENVNLKDKYSNIDEYLNENLEKPEESLRKFDYMMLDRLKTDCDHFLGNGNGFIGHLYYKDVEKHIAEMKKIYNSFSEEEKPEWINLEDIEKYQMRMSEMLVKNSEEEI